MRIIILISAVLTQTACTSLTAVSIASTIATGKSITDQALSQSTGADCNTVKYLTDNQKHSYLCEISPKYNRNGI